MANIEIKPLEPRASWLHCDLCGADDQEAADWIITADTYRDKRHMEKITLKICDDCLREVVEEIADAGITVGLEGT